MKWQLLASAPTLIEISECIARFYGGEEKTLRHEGVLGYWSILRGGKITPMAALDGMRVIEKRGRFRFEMSR